MLRSKAYVKVTNKGSVVKVVREHYLRDDIGCGVRGCPACSALMAGMPPSLVMMDPVEGQQAVHRQFSERIVIPDTNIILHHVLKITLKICFDNYS